MNYLKALKSGKPFKRPHHNKWFIENPSFKPNPPNHVFYNVQKHHYPFVTECGVISLLGKDSILATDWEIKK